MRADKAYQDDYEPNIDPRTQGQKWSDEIQDRLDAILWSDDRRLSKRGTVVCAAIVGIAVSTIITLAIIHAVYPQ